MDKAQDQKRHETKKNTIPVVDPTLVRVNTKVKKDTKSILKKVRLKTALKTE